MPFGIPKGAMCVQRFDDSHNSAIHTTYRVLPRSSSMREPRDPLLKVLNLFINYKVPDKKILEFLYFGLVYYKPSQSKKFSEEKCSQKMMKNQIR